MKETVKVTSVLCAAVAAISIFMGVRVLTGRGYFMQYAFFSMASRGTGMSFVGNLVNMLFMVIGYGCMAFFGLTSGSNKEKVKKAFVWGIIMTAASLLSLIFSIMSGNFNIGDLILLVLPAVYTYAVLKTV